MKINMKNGSSIVTIDGRAFTGRNVVINNDKVYVDGVEQSGSLVGSILVEIEGDVEHLELGAGKVTIDGHCKEVHTQSGDIECDIVSGNVSTMSGDVSCGDIKGSVKTMSGDINHQ